MKNINISNILFILCFSFVIFIFGIITGVFNLPPTYQVVKAIEILCDPVIRSEFFIQSTYIRNVEYTLPINTTKSYMKEKTLDINGSGLVGYEPSETSNGYTLINGMHKHNYAIKLLDMKGNMVHIWDVPYCKFWTCKDKANEQTTNWVKEIGGSTLFPNGDVIFSHQYSALTRLDKDCNVIWKKNYRAHHLLYQDKEGNIWTPAVKSINAKYKFGKNIFIVKDPEFVFKISPEGELLEEYNITDILIQSDKKGVFGSLLNNYYSKNSPVLLEGKNLTHLNDVEIVEDPEVYALPIYNKGDILVSMNRINSIALIDPKTKQIKWLSVNPFLRQHDPDIQKDGSLIVFDNNGGGKKGFLECRSRILSISPINNQATVLFEKNKDNLFYSYNRGNQQKLPDGNLLITETTKGHVFEINKEGKVVWEYFDIWDKDYISFISQAIRYPEEYVKFLDKK